MTTVVETGTPVNLTASGAIALQAGSLIGFYVNSTTLGTVVIRDGRATGTAISGTITPAVGFHSFPAACATGCYATLGATIDVTFFYQ